MITTTTESTQAKLNKNYFRYVCFYMDTNLFHLRDCGLNSADLGWSQKVDSRKHIQNLISYKRSVFLDTVSDYQLLQEAPVALKFKMLKVRPDSGWLYTNNGSNTVRESIKYMGTVDRAVWAEVRPTVHIYGDGSRTRADWTHLYKDTRRPEIVNMININPLSLNKQYNLSNVRNTHTSTLREAKILWYFFLKKSLLDCRQCNIIMILSLEHKIY